MTPLLVMEMLNDLYSQLDMLTVKHKVYKVETIGDCFMAVGGAPERCTGVLAAQKIALFALDVLGKMINTSIANIFVAAFLIC
jgi:class 3 adenylate cyclase